MAIAEKIQTYLIDLSVSFEEVGDGTWLINDEEKGLTNVVLVVAGPVLIIRMKVMEAPARRREELFERLLRLNAEDLLHGAYALEGDNIILLDTLELDSMDLEELRASLEAIGLAVVQHYKALKPYREGV